MRFRHSMYSGSDAFFHFGCSEKRSKADESPAQAKRTLNRFLKPDLLCIDDFGMKHFPAKSAESLLEIIVRRHQNRSTLLTSNRPIEDWGQLLGDVPAATA